MFEKISLAGDLGSGKSTVSDILVELLDAEYYSTGAIVRSIAQKHGMSVVELNHYMETHPEIDREIDDGLVALSDVDKRLIIDSRMAWHFTKDTFKVYLSTDIETSALRIMNANRKGEHAATLEDTIRDTRARRESEKKRYLEQYGVDIKDLGNYSLVVDTTYATPKEIADCIKWGLEMWKKDKSFKQVCISPLRLSYPDDEADMALMMELSGRLDEDEEIELPCIIEKDGEFYIRSGHEAALAYALSNRTFIPARLTKGDPCGNFVKMHDSL